MNDDEVWNAVKNTLSDVRMERPVEEIAQRGQARRRNRGLLGVVAGGGLAAVAAFALAGPMASAGDTGDAGTAPADSPPVAAASAPALEPVAYSLTTLAGGEVKLTLNPDRILNPAALEKALAGAGIPAVVKADVVCTPKGEELPQSDTVLANKLVETAEGTRYDLIISPAKMPEGSVIHFSVFAIRTGEGYAKAGIFLVEKDAPMNCRTFG